MKWSNNKKSTQIITYFVVVLLMFFGGHGQAQTVEKSQSKSVSITTAEDGKVKLKVTIKDGDDTKNFEKTYDRYEDIASDPDLEKYGIELDEWSFNGPSKFGSPRLLFRGQGFQDDEDDNFFMFDLDSMRESLHDMMKHNFQGNQFFFNFDDDSPFIMNMDSLSNRFNFHFGNGKMFFNGEEFMDMDSLQETLKERFGNMHFDFDFDNLHENMEEFRHKGFFGQSDEEDGGFRVISRARVFVRAAKDKDKETVGTDKMDDLEIKDISFYPNPSDGKFSLEIATTNKGPLQVKIVSPTGKLVYDKTETSGASDFLFDIDISDEREGIYILQVIQNNKALTKRIIIE